MRLVTALSFGKFFAEAQKIAVGIAEHELVHLPLTRFERGENCDASRAELGFESGSGICGEIEIDAAGIMALDEVGGFAEMNVEVIAAKEGIEISLLITRAREAEEPVEVHGTLEVVDRKDRCDALKYLGHAEPCF